MMRKPVYACRLEARPKNPFGLGDRRMDEDLSFFIYLFTT